MASSGPDPAMDKATPDAKWKEVLSAEEVKREIGRGGGRNREDAHGLSSLDPPRRRRGLST